MSSNTDRGKPSDRGGAAKKRSGGSILRRSAGMFFSNLNDAEAASSCGVFECLASEASPSCERERDSTRVDTPDQDAFIMLESLSVPVSLQEEGALDVRKNLSGFSLAAEQFSSTAASSARTLRELDLTNNRELHYSILSAREQKLTCIATDVPAYYSRNRIVHESDFPSLCEMYKSLREGQQTACWIGRIADDADLTYHWCKLTYIVSGFDGQGKPSTALGIEENIDHLKRMDLMRTGFVQLCNALKSSSIFFCEADLSLDRMLASDEDTLSRVSYALPCSYSSFISRCANRFVHQDDLDRFLSQMRRRTLLDAYHLGEREKCFEFRFLNKHQQVLWIDLTVYLIAGYHSSGSVSAFMSGRDITAKKSYELTLKMQAERDLMTNVFNREATVRSIGQRLASPDAGNLLCAMLMIDIDDFKRINDTYGHVAGDQVLKEFASRISQEFRGDDIIGRMGGDEFVVFFNHISRYEMLPDKVGKLSAILSEPVIAGEQSIETSASIGMAVAQQNTVTFETLFECADRAMYESKSQGKHRCTTVLLPAKND
ncbi:MAG: GGDEF domain-containing protein [Bacillota bacterium]